MRHDDDWPGRDDAMWDAMRHHVGLPLDCSRPQDTSYVPYVSKEEFEDDLSLAAGLFDTLTRDDKGVIVSDRIKPGGRGRPSLDEQKARDAAARLLMVISRGDCGEACQRSLRRFCADLAALFRSDDDVAEPFELVLSRRPGRKAPSIQFYESIASSLSGRFTKTGVWRPRMRRILSAV